ncbi:hypothetical protein ONO23_03509 [Micromonospora noduli]|nr:hypothetical protein ONO23_03509 [Micromonospora noduli]
MRPGDTESHRHCPQPARTRRCSRTRRAVPPPASLAGCTPVDSRPRHPPSRRASAATHEILDSFRSRGTETVQDLLAATNRTAPSASGDPPSASGDPPTTSDGHLPASRHPPPAGTRRHGIRPGRHRDVRDQRPATGDQRPATSDQRPATSDQRPATGDRRPATGDRRPTTSDQRPATSDQRPTTNDQRPTTNDQVPTGRKRHPAPQRPLPAGVATSATSDLVPRKRKCRWPAPRGWGCRPAVGVVQWCLVRWFCDVARVSCSSTGRPGRWPAAPTGRRRPGRPTPAPSARRRSAACPATRQPASSP